MANSDANRISAASGMMLMNLRIGKQNRSPVAGSQAIQDTLEMSDGDANYQSPLHLAGDESGEAAIPTNIGLPGDVLDISG